MINNQFKGLLVIIFCLFNVAHLKSKCIDMENGFILHGAIVEEGTNRPLAYVNLGIAGKNVGTVSDINGAFNLNIPSANRLDTLTFSMVGYEPKKLALSKINTDNLIITLKAAVYDISEVIVSNKKFKRKTVGNNASGKVVRFSLGGDDLGAELGSLIKIRKRKTFIKTFKWFVVDNPFERVRFRLNIYDYKADKPDSNILKQNIIVEFDKCLRESASGSILTISGSLFSRYFIKADFPVPVLPKRIVLVFEMFKSNSNSLFSTKALSKNSSSSAARLPMSKLRLNLYIFFAKGKYCDC